jgi:hypothetical protein
VPPQAWRLACTGSIQRGTAVCASRASRVSVCVVSVCVRRRLCVRVLSCCLLLHRLSQPPPPLPTSPSPAPPTAHQHQHYEHTTITTTHELPLRALSHPAAHVGVAVVAEGGLGRRPRSQPRAPCVATGLGVVLRPGLG